MAGKAQSLFFLTTRGVHIVDTNLPLVHWSKHANSKLKGVKNLLLAYHNFARYFQNNVLRKPDIMFDIPVYMFRPGWTNTGENI
jgi:hypothetical protein